uniref:Threonine aspartase 1 n=1 Tax=Cacopsylla melanoneura TaxID=428564 RepID=A0A8D8Z3F9_9HEMI
MSSASAGPTGKGFVGIHIGAGKHSKKRYPLYSKVLAMACKQAINLIQNGGSALKATALATALLEDCKLFNAGSGSNLTWEGGVECDAGIMDGKTGLSGAVGAVSRVQNPIHVAYQLCQNQCGLDNGLIRPCMMVGHGAVEYAWETGASRVFETEAEMVSPYAQRDYVKTKEKVNELRQQAEENVKIKAERNMAEEDDDKETRPSTSNENPIGENNTKLIGEKSSFLLNSTYRTVVKDSTGSANIVHRTVEKASSTRSIDGKVRKRKLDTNPLDQEYEEDVEDLVGKSAKSNQEDRREQIDNLMEESVKANQEDREDINNDIDILEESAKVNKETETEKKLDKQIRLDRRPCGIVYEKVDEREEDEEEMEEIRGKVDKEEEEREKVEEEEEELRLDTVGVVCVDLAGNVASSCSSGGIILKRSGRIGQACIRGSGWWAQNPTANSYGVATSTTGPGEYLIRTSLAREVARVFENKVVSSPDGSEDEEEDLVHDGNSVLLEKCIREQFLESTFLRDVPFPKQAGLILLLTSPHDNAPEEFLWAFSSHSFCVGYMSTQDKQPHTRMSSLPDGYVPGTVVSVESVFC